MSGGQRQAITIARALVKRPPILLFDEPTSAMDARTEKKFIEQLKGEQLTSTLIVITHRTSLLALADHVLVVDQGKVVFSGSVDSFLNARLRKPDAAQAAAAAAAAEADSEALRDREKEIRMETQALKASIAT